LDEGANDVTTLAANYNGTISYTDKTALTEIGRAARRKEGGGPTTSGSTSNKHDVKMTVLAGGLVIGDAVGAAGDDDVTLGTGNLTLNVVGSITQTTDNVITAAGLQVLGSGGTVRLDEGANDVTTLAANYNGTISYTDKTALTVGTVGDTAMAGGGPTTSGITSTSHDVKLTVLAGGLVIGDAVGAAGDDDVTLGTGNLTLNVVGSITQTTDNVITAAGLQLLGSGGTVPLDEGANDVTTLAANYNGTLSYADATALTVGTVGGSCGMDGGTQATRRGRTSKAVRLP